MQTKTCPDCGDDIALTATRHMCGWQLKQVNAQGLSRNTELAAMARHRFETEPPTPLTPQQWYNVCKFFPLAAAHCKPKYGITIADVGPDHPLDATSRQGPLLRRAFRHDPEADLERRAIEGGA